MNDTKEIIDNMENFERVVDIAIDNGWNDCRIDELRKYLDIIIDSCELGYRDTLNIDSDVLTTILKVYSKGAVEGKIKELKAEKEAQLQYALKEESEEENVK